MLLQHPPTDITDIIGFIVSLAAVLFLIIRSMRAKRYREQHPEEAALEEAEQKETLKNFLKSLEMDMDELDEEEKRPVVVKKAPPPRPQQLERAKPTRKVSDDFRFQTRVEQRKLETAIEQRRLQTAIEARKQDYGAHLVSEDLRAYSKQFIQQPQSQARNLLDRFKTKKEMVILQQILNPPKGFERF